MKKNIYKTLLSTFALFALTFTANAQSGADGNISWEIQDGTLTISGEGNMPDYSSANPSPWSAKDIEITKITIETGITCIGKHAFQNFQRLEEIELPEGLTEIKYFALNKCYTLKSITLPESLLSIEDEAIQNTGLESLHIPKNLTNIGVNNFGNCNKLASLSVDNDNTAYSVANNILFNKDMTTILRYLPGKAETSYTIPAEVTSIGSYAFLSSTGLKNIDLHDAIVSIGNYAFQGSGLEAISIPNGITSIAGVFAACSSLTEITLPQNLETIGSATFTSCTSLKKITIPEKVTSIGDNAFMSCNALEEVTVLNPEPIEISTKVFNYIDLTKVTLCVPASSKADYDEAEVWKTFKEIIEVAGSNDFTLYYSTTDGKLHKGSVIGDEITEGFTGTYTGNGATLTLDNFEFETTAATAIEFFKDITLNLVGDSYITSTFVNEEKNGNNSYGIYTQRSLTIQSDADGTLTATGGTVTNGNSSGVWTVGATSTLTINSGTLEGVGGTADALMGGSQGIRINLGSLDISGGYLIGRNSSAANSHGVAISNNGSLTMSGGSLTTTAADAYNFSVGLDVNGSVNITGGTITATGGIAEECSSYGIYVYGDFSLTGGTVEATCGTGSESQAGIFIYDGTSTTPGATIVGGANTNDTDELTFSDGTYKSNGATANYVKISGTTGGSSAIGSIEGSGLLNIYPNPAIQSFGLNGLTGEAAISIYTLAGHEVKTTTVNGNERIAVDFASGVYFVKIKTAAGETIQKLVIK